MDNSIKADLCATVHGDSMIGAGIHDGDKAFIIKDYEYEDGKIYALRINSDREAVPKKVYKGESSFILNPCNDEYNPIVLGPDDVSIIGECVGVYHAYER